MGKKTARKPTKWIREYRHQRELYGKLKKYAPDILASKRFLSTKRHLQHGDVTVYRHSMNVALASADLAGKLHLNLRERDLVRGALLHDYFLYDWHIPNPEAPHKLHGFHHAERALKNASEEYELTDCERDIIKHHMWPLNLDLPKSREAWIVVAADKWVSLKETAHISKGHGKQKYGIVVPAASEVQ